MTLHDTGRVGAAWRRRTADWPDWAPIALAAGLVSFVAVLARAWPILTGTSQADILNYQKVGQAILDGHFSELYALPYPYPPLWMFFETAAQWWSQRFDASYSTLIKLPILAADVALAVLALLIIRARGGSVLKATIWAMGIALSPVMILITGFHGQFDSMAIALLVAAAYFGEEAPEQRRSLLLSATLLGLAIAMKAFPVLVLPFFLWRCCKDYRSAALFAALALAPTAILLAPYVLVGWDSVREGLIGYDGLTDQGWVALIRTWVTRTTGLPSRFLPGERSQEFVRSGRLMFLVVYALMAVWYGSRQRALDSSLLVFLAFLFLYPGASSQYLTWVVPLGIIATDFFVLPYMAAATVALIGYYLWFWPAILHREGDPFTVHRSIDVYYWGGWAWWIVTGAWLGWRAIPRTAKGPHRLPKLLVWAVFIAAPIGAIVIGLEAADVFEKARDIVRMY